MILLRRCRRLEGKLLLLGGKERRSRFKIKENGNGESLVVWVLGVGLECLVRCVRIPGIKVHNIGF